MGIDQAITASRRRAVFLDRDGVLNRNVFYPDFSEWESPRTLADLTIDPAIIAPLKSLHDAGFLLFIVTNQPSHAKGKTSMENLLEIKHAFGQFFATHGIPIAAEYYCFHHPKGIIPAYTQSCDCRKPKPYFLLEAARNFNLDLSKSWMIGDRDTDIACGAAAGVNTIKLPPDHPTSSPSTANPTHQAHSFHEAVTLVLTSAQSGT